MRKKIVFVGIALMIIAAIIFFADSSLISPQLQMTTQALNVSANSYGYVTLNLTPPSPILFIVRASTPLNVYLMNQSGFSSWNLEPKAANQTGLSDAYSLSKSGVLLIYQNATIVSLPQLQNVTAAPSFNSSSSYPSGKYYLVEDNTYGSPSSSKEVVLQVVYPDYLVNGTTSNTVATQFTTQIIRSSEVALAALIVGVASLLVLVYGLLSKPKETTVAASSAPVKSRGKETKEERKDDKEIDDLYRKAKLASKKRNKTDE